MKQKRSVKSKKQSFPKWLKIRHRALPKILR